MKYLTLAGIVFFMASCWNSEKKTVDRPFKTEQIYMGYSETENYLCYLKISPDNKVVFIYETEGNEMYGEHSGTIKAISDSTFHVSCKLTFGECVCKPFNLDSLYIGVNPPSLIDTKSILVQYENEELMSNRSMDKSSVNFAFDPSLFNEYTPAYILTDHTHPITGNALTIKASFGCAYSFFQGDEVDFDIVISGDSLYSIKEDPAFQTGPFRLKKQ